MEGDMHDNPLENRAPPAEALNLWPLTMANQPTAFQTLVIPQQTNIATIMARAAETSAADKCAEGNDDPMCETSVTSSQMTLPIVLGVA